MADFVHLNVHSCYSMLEGANRIEEIVAAAAGMGMPALALTDTDGLFGVVSFVRACESNGIHPLIGVELTEPSMGGVSKRPLTQSRRAILIARDSSGYQEICRVVTARHLDDAFDWETTVAGLSSSVYVISRDARLISRRVEASGLRDATRVEIVSCGGSDGRRERNRYLELAASVNIRPVVTNAVRFVRPEGFAIHRLLTALRLNATTGMLQESDLESPGAWLLSQSEALSRFHHAPQAVDETLRIAKECSVSLDMKTRKLPRFLVPGKGDSYLYLRGIALQGLSERYRDGRILDARDVLEREMAVIKQMNLADYFLICWDIIRFARSQNIPCLGRGSAANSIVSFCLHITHVDPLAHNLFFERFLNDQRASLPDFDLDFGTEDREKVFDYIFKIYGDNRAAMIGTHVTFQVRGSFREVATALGYPKGEVDGFIKRLPHFSLPSDLESKLADSPETSALPLNSEPFATIYRFAEKIGGFPRHMATHPCGLVITPGPLFEFMPLQRGDKGLPITQWSMVPVEEAGLLKIDILGQKGLEVISYTAQAAREQGFSLPENPKTFLADSRTREWMREGRTIGCFYIESPAMIGLIRQARCDDFECLTALSSIIRPGVSNYGGKHSYLKRHLKLEPETFLHPLVKPILRDTKGCLIYQEQVIRMASELAGLSLGEADDLRRLMSFKKNRKKLSDYRDRFFSGCREKGMSGSIIEEVYRQVESFAGYAFCKAHSASFALESFESMYFKSHFPAEFMAAVLSGGGGYYGGLEYLEEARRLGICIHSPCINSSLFRFTGSNGHLRIGLMQVKSLSQDTADRIVSVRSQMGPFVDLIDFLSRVHPKIEESRNLAKCGGMKCIGKTIPEVLWGIEIFYKQLPPEDARDYSAMIFLIRDLWGKINPIPNPPLQDMMAWELEILGMTPSAHPFRMFPDEIAKARRLRPVIRSVDLAARSGRETYLIGWRVIGKKTRTKNKGELMIFVTFSDEWGRFETTFFPASFGRNAKELLRGAGPFLIKGKVEIEFGVPFVIADRIQLLALNQPLIRPTYGPIKKPSRARGNDKPMAGVTQHGE